MFVVFSYLLGHITRSGYTRLRLVAFALRARLRSTDELPTAPSRDTEELK